MRKPALERLVAVCMSMVFAGPVFATGGIAGTVSDTSAGGIEGVQVFVLRSDGGHLEIAVTNLSGAYTATELPPGSYVAFTRNEQGFIDELYNDMPCPGGCYFFGGTPIQVNDGSTTGGVDFVLDDGGRVTGAVTSIGGGTPLEGVDVKIYTAVDPADPDIGGDLITIGTTDASGTYLSRTGLPTGSYVALTSNTGGFIEEVWDDHPCDGACDPANGDSIEVTEGATVEDIDFHLDGGGRISGTIMSSQMGAISGTRIDVYDAGGASVTSATPAADGTWITDAGLVAGSYFLLTDNWWGFIDELWQDIPCAAGCTVTDGTPVAVTAGATTAGIDIVLDPGGQIGGTITEDGSSLPVSQAGVEVYDLTGARVGTAFADDQGAYTAGGLPTGSYRLRAYSWDLHVAELFDDHSCIPECPLDEGDPVAVTAPGLVSPIDFALVQGGRIDGTLSSGGSPVWDAEIQVFNDLGDPVTATLVDSFGAFSTDALPPGNYFLMTDNQQGLVDEIWEDIPCADVCDPETGDLIVLTPGTIADLEIVLESGGSISGTVTAVDGDAPAEDITILLFDDLGELATLTLTDEDGIYLVDGLPTGSYYLRALSTGLLVGEVWPDLSCSSSCDPTQGTPIAVPPGGAVEDIDLQLESSVLFIDGFESGNVSQWN